LPETEPKPGQPTLPEAAVDMTPALQLLALLQREGRLVDFLQQDMVGFSDAEVGVAARLVHAGCRRALDQAGRVSPLSQDVEGARVSVSQGYDARTIRLIGTVSGEPPYRGILVHRGWRIEDFDLGRTTPGSDSTVIAPMEIEL